MKGRSALAQGAFALAMLLLPPASAFAQSEAELRLAVERARLTEQELESELAVQERLVEEGLASDVELRRARSRLERARIETEMARAALTAALPPARLLSAVRHVTAEGQPGVRLTFERTGRAAERFGQSVVVSVLSDSLVVGRPFQELLEFRPGGPVTASLSFELIRDVDQVTVTMLSGSRHDEVLVPLQIDTQGAPVRLRSLNSSQDGPLGDSVDFDVVVERASLEVGSIALETEGLPESFGSQVLDEEKRSRLRLVQFPQGVNRVPVVVRIEVPQQEDAAWSGRVIDFPVRATVPGAVEPLATIGLHLRPVGRPELSLVTDTLSVEIGPGEVAEIAVAVVNSGRATAFEVQPRLGEPIGLQVEAEPRRISEIPAGDRATVVVRARPRPEAVDGDYQVRMRALTTQGGGYAESEDLVLRVTVRRRVPWLLVGLGLVVVVAGGGAGWWWRGRVHRAG